MRDYWSRNARAAPESPSRIVIVKNWHRACFPTAVPFFCSTPAEPFFRPDRISTRLRCERRSRMAAAFGGHRFSGAKRP